MPVKFILDRQIQEHKKLLEEILELIQRRPPKYNKEAIILVNFIKAVFHAASLTKKEKELKEVKEIREKIEKKLEKELPPPPIPPKEAPKIEVPKPKIEVKKEIKPEVRPEFSYSFDVFGEKIGVEISKDKNGKLKYNLIFPIVNAKLVNDVMKIVGKKFEKNPEILKDKEKIGEIVRKICKKDKIVYSEELLKKIVFYLKRDLLGFKRLDLLMRDKNLEGIYCEGPKKPVVVKHKNFPEKIETNINIGDEEELKDLIKTIARKIGFKIGPENPVLETTYKGVAVEAIYGVGGATSKISLSKE